MGRGIRPGEVACGGSGSGGVPGAPIEGVPVGLLVNIRAVLPSELLHLFQSEFLQFFGPGDGGPNCGCNGFRIVWIEEDGCVADYLG
jgi:hypothetical protein